MNKKVLILGAGGLLVLGGAAFTLVATAGVPEPIDTSLRGKPEYYTSELMTQDLPEIMTNLRDSGGKYIQIVATAEYRIGPELEPPEVPALFASRQAKLKDRFNMLMSGKTLSDVETREQKEVLKEELREVIQKVIFPDQKGQVEGILFRDFKIQ